MLASEKEALFQAVGEYVREIVAKEISALSLEVFSNLKQGPQGHPGVRGEKGDKGDPGEKGADGAPGEPGRDGKDFDEAAVISLVEGIVSRMAPKDGKDGRDGVDGKDADPELIARLIAQEIAKIPAPKDGRDGLPGIPGRDGKDGSAGRDGKDGADGLGFDDIVVEYDGERSYRFSFRRGAAGDPVARSTEFGAFKMPIIIDRGVWKEGTQYERGDFVSWGGSGFVAQKDTTAEPGKSDEWRLVVKRGRDGRDGKNGKDGAQGPQGPRGLSFDGQRHP